MLNDLLNNFKSTPEKFINEILKDKFDEKILLKLLQSGINIDYKDDNGNTFLNICINKNKFNSVKWLLDNQCNPNIANNDNQIAVEIAIKSGNTSISKLLLDNNKVNCNYQNKEGRTLLHEAVINGKVDIVNDLIDHNADVNILDKNKRNILFDAISYGEDKIVSTVLTSKDLEINNIDIEGKTVLHQPAVLNNDDLATTLLNHGADPTIVDKDGKSFLFHTALRGEEGEELLNLAVGNGFNVNGKLRNNNSILMEVMFAFSKLSDNEKKRRHELMNTATKLVQHGIDVNAINHHGETALFDAVRENDVEAVSFLLQDGVDVNHRNKKFETALSIAVIKGIVAIDIIILLMEFNASITIQVKDLKTILEMLNDIILHTHNNHPMENQNLLSQIDIDNGQYLIVLKDILNITSVPLDYKDFSGDPIYFKPLLYGNIDLFRLYVKYGIDINTRNTNGRTLFQEYVCRMFDLNIHNKNFEDIILLLMNNSVDANAKMPYNGETVLSYIASKKRCNVKLFKSLVKRARFNLALQDKNGRTVMHSCITGNNIELLKMLHASNINIINIPDFYGMLPITYVALSGNSQLLLDMINLNSHITSNKSLSTKAIEKYSSLLVNLNNLTKDVYDKDDLRKINIVQEQIRQEFLAI